MSSELSCVSWASCGQCLLPWFAWRESRLWSVVCGLIITVASCLTTVAPGHVGVVSVFGKVHAEKLDSGLHVINPFAKVTQMSTQTKNYTMTSSGEGRNDDVSAISKDGLKMPIDVSLFFRVTGAHAPVLYREFGNDEAIAEKLVRPSARTAVRQGTSTYNATEAFSTHRDKLGPLFHQYANKSLEELLVDKDLPKDAIYIVQVQLRRIEPPVKVKNAIEEKLNEQQRAEKMVYTLERERKEAERKEIEANGIQKFQDIVSKGIDERLLKWKGIEATLKLAESPNTKIVIVGGGDDGLPIIMNAAPTPAN